ncbi:hypothetical protein ES332_A08G196700v1 [Gossypium tomentosum]|uniref:Non-haem dioxygenase N-terminal domain-containing protein n=1 Tax=Gossypium tomentosum TaxID=34277 RepID=A0A5D2PK56_GOSTO|nr:hypothetical protein ES332_A08G196700v1 [Gossypium tomentosum]TYI15584.1 hypothetical protein ES332_A08G196700v1 [Gossypium tomentosum]
MCDALQLPIVDLSSPDRFSTANSIRQACIDHGFFYLVNHGVDEELVNEVFEQSSKFFSLPIEEKMKVIIKNYNGYSPLFAGKLDTTLSTKGDSKEGFYVSQLAGDLNQWPLEEDLPSWRSTIETYYQLLSAGTKLLSLIALSLKLDEDFFEKVGAFNEPLAVYYIIQGRWILPMRKYMVRLLIQILECSLFWSLMVYRDFRFVGRNPSNRRFGRMCQARVGHSLLTLAT